MRRFSAAEPGYRARCVAAPQHARLRRRGGGLHCLLQDRPEEGVPPDPVNPEDVQKTAITTPFGLFEYKRMPFGLRNAGPSFQRHVDRAIRDCQAAFAWVDDIVICSRNHEEHVIHVRQVLQALQDNGLVIHAEKCVWGVQELEYLGHKISVAGVLPLPSHVAAIQDFSRPTIIKELQAFLGMVNFYRRFLPSIARMLRPLTDALRSGRKGADKVEWSAAMDAAFAGVKQALLTATHLAHSTVGAELSVVVDTSAMHVGACVQQQLPGRKEWQRLGFFSLRSWRLLSRSIPPSTGSCSLVMQEYVTSGTCWTAGGLPFSRTTSRSHTPWQECLTCGRHANPDSCPTWRSIHQTSATSPGQPT